MDDIGTVRDLLRRIRFTGSPIAHPSSVVRRGNARFTVLTSKLLRLEWSDSGQFEDRGTFAFPTRFADPPHYDSRTEGDELVIDTGSLRLRYLPCKGKFDRENLSISLLVASNPVTWVPGEPDLKNLRGTRRTLDACEGDASLAPGILSRAGWALYDDSSSVVFNAEDGWVAPRTEGARQDWYFFGYGHDYKQALGDYVRFGGKVPLIPRYVLGLWWSRYWAYSDEELRQLVAEFEAHGVPLDVLVIDMDWHLPDSWTGYTWNRALFPDPSGFLRWVREKGLRATLNLHPAEGVQPFEAMYERFAKAMGVNPDDGTPIPFRITNKQFVRNYFELLHHPMEEQGVDFWWVDWQQGEASEMKGLDPLPWLNHLHFRDSSRRGQRAMLYSRWGGLGNHRYHIGFSGDTYAVWSALQFQPSMTATASNVGFGWWSHDIGGHMGGATDPELYARWVQFGALSPSLRLHATKDLRAERRPWAYPDDVFRAAKRAVELRYRLLPYIYTMARVAADTGVSLCRPMYYEYPEEDAAYAARYQYYFGGQAVAAPIVFPCDPESGMAATDVWVPPGMWTDYATRETFEGPRWVHLVGDLFRVPILVRAGGILPLAAGFSDALDAHLASGTSGTLRKDVLVVAVFPGADGHFRLYEDDGLTEDYRADNYEWTDIRSRQVASDTWTVAIAPVEGHCAALPERRAYEIRLEGSARPDSVLVDGEPVADWHYDSESLVTVVPVASRSKSRGLKVTARAMDGMSALGDALNRRIAIDDVRRLLGDDCPHDETDIDQVLRCTCQGRLDAIGRLGGPFVRFVDFVTPEEARQALGQVIVGAPSIGDEAYDVVASFALHRRGGTERRVVRRSDVTESLILAVPFAHEGAAQPLRWEARIDVTWRGESLAFSHRSEPLFPSVHAWRCVVLQDGDDTATLRGVTRGEILVQHTDSLGHSLREPFVIDLQAYHRAALERGEQVEATLTATVISPDERDAVILFRSAGPTSILLNGAEIEDVFEETPGTDPSPFFQNTRTTTSVHLNAGQNALVVRSRPLEGWRGLSWLFGAAFAAPEGQMMGDLAYEPGPEAAHS